MRKIDDPDETEDHRQTETQQRIERSVDQPQHELAQNRGQRHAEDGRHGSHSITASAHHGKCRCYFLTRGQAGSGCDPSASSPDITLITL